MNNYNSNMLEVSSFCYKNRVNQDFTATVFLMGNVSILNNG